MKHFNYSNVVATLALFFALGGAAVAGQHYLIHSTSQIKPSVLAQLRGAQGPRGPQGAQGPPGLAGAPGVGSQGPVGPPGSSASTAKLCQNGLREEATYLNAVGLEEEASANPLTREEGEDDRNTAFIVNQIAQYGC